MNQIGTMDEQAKFVKRKYERMGYRVHSGLQFGADLVLYAHRPDLVHSDFCINISSDGELYWSYLLLLMSSECDHLFILLQQDLIFSVMLYAVI